MKFRVQGRLCRPITYNVDCEVEAESEEEAALKSLEELNAQELDEDIEWLESGPEVTFVSAGPFMAEGEPTEVNENDCVHCCGTGDKPYTQGAEPCTYCGGTGCRSAESMIPAEPGDAESHEPAAAYASITFAASLDLNERFSGSQN